MKHIIAVAGLLALIGCERGTNPAQMSAQMSARAAEVPTVSGEAATTEVDVKPYQGAKPDVPPEEIAALNEERLKMQAGIAPEIALSNAPAIRAMPRDGTPCTDIEGSMTDPDPLGRNIRDQPSVNGRLIGNIPAKGQRRFPAKFEILESRNGWLKIRGASFDETIAEEPVPKIYEGEGWISGKKLHVGLQTRLGFSAPSHDAPNLLDGRPDYYLDNKPQAAIVSCSGKWVLVDFPYKYDRDNDRNLLAFKPEAVISRNPLVLRAWVTGVCNAQETTCDGTNGDMPEGQ